MKKRSTKARRPPKLPADFPTYAELEAAMARGTKIWTLTEAGPVPEPGMGWRMFEDLTAIGRETGRRAGPRKAASAPRKVAAKATLLARIEELNGGRRLKLSQEQLAEKLGVSRGRVRRALGLST